MAHWFVKMFGGLIGDKRRVRYPDFLDMTGPGDLAPWEQAAPPPAARHDRRLLLAAAPVRRRDDDAPLADTFSAIALTSTDYTAAQAADVQPSQDFTGHGGLFGGGGAAAEWSQPDSAPVSDTPTVSVDTGGGGGDSGPAGGCDCTSNPAADPLLRPRRDLRLPVRRSPC